MWTVAHVRIITAALLLGYSGLLAAKESRHCRELLKQENALWDASNFQEFIPVARQEMNDCSAGWSEALKNNYVARIGTALVRTKQYEEAIPVLRRCLASDPEDVGCLLDLGLANAHLGKCELAIAAFKAVLTKADVDSLTEDAHQVARLWLGSYANEGPLSALATPQNARAQCSALAIGNGAAEN